MFALVLLPVLAGCTGRNIGGVDSGWNGLVANEGVVYVGTKQGTVKALTDGGREEGVQEKWSFPTEGSPINLQGVYGTPLVVGNLLYVAAQDGYLYALDTEAGSISDRGWRWPSGEQSDAAPLVGSPVYDPINQLVVFGSEDGNLYGFDSDTGALFWDRPFPTGDKIWSTPAVRDGVAYFGSHDHKVYAVSLADGSELWSYTTGGVVAGRPLLLDGMVIVGSFDKKLYALDALSGNRVWDFEAENWFWAGAVSNGQTIFAPSMDGNIYALDRSGVLQWSHNVDSSIVSPPVLVPAGLVVAAKTGRLILLDVKPGAGVSRELFQITLGDAEIKAPLIAAGDSVYVGSQDSTVRRVQVKTGGQVEMWCFHTEDRQCG